MRQWAIAIGINHYQFFQPLSYAQQDAQGIRNFLIQEAGFPPEQCILLTNSSAPVWSKTTQPDRTTIRNWLELLVQQYVQPGDVLWFFFSGYGVSYKGQDYLVPVEGIPTAIPSTAIPIETVFNTLKAAVGVSILLLLDMNRSQGALSPEPIGVETAQLATATGIPTILSCQPEQFSQETAGLNHGLFTAGLLESLRAHPGITLAALGNHLSDRLNELSNHYWRPHQHPLLLWPPARHQQVLLPLQGVASGGNAVQPPTSSLYSATSKLSAAELPPNLGIASGIPSAPQPDSTASSKSPSPQNGHLVASANQSHGALQNNGQSNVTTPPSAPLLSLSKRFASFWSTPERSEDRASYFWSGITVAALLLALGVLWKNWPAFNPATSSSHQNQTSMRGRTFQNSQLGDSQANNSQTEQTPISERSRVAQAIETAMVQADQASPFYYAIEKLSTVPPDDPEYQTAQQTINKWSQDIMVIARRRAEQRSFDNAILAARLVPKSQQSIYKKAQQAIEQWCPSVPSQTARNPLQQQWVDTLCQSR
jgi:hypothetical protein